MMDLLRFPGLSISKDEFEKKYSIKLSNYEWQTLTRTITSSWKESIDEFRLLAFKHIRFAMEENGYNVKLEGKDIVFKQGSS